MQLCAVQMISWKMCLGCGNMCLNVLKAQANMGEAMFGGMSVENKSVFQHRRYSAKGKCGDHVCQVKRTLTL